MTSSSSIPTDSNQEQRCSCLSKLLIITNESPVLNSFSPFSLLLPIPFSNSFRCVCIFLFLLHSFVVPIESNFTVQQDRYVRPSNQQYSNFFFNIYLPLYALAAHNDGFIVINYSFLHSSYSSIH